MSDVYFLKAALQGKKGNISLHLQEFKRLKATYNAARDRADLMAGASSDSLTQAQVLYYLQAVLCAHSYKPCVKDAD